MGKIYLTSTPQQILEELQIPKNDLRIFEREEFKITDAKEVIAEAYISSHTQKYIAIIANSFNKEAQNALLKVLEEPPHNIIFLILTENKSALLPTIRSRMPIINQIQKAPLQPLELNLKNLSFQNIFTYLKSLNNLSRNDSQEVLARLFKSIKSQNITLTQKELDFFDTALKANFHYEKLQILLVPILLGLMGKK